jgi:hypothetical protein
LAADHGKLLSNFDVRSGGGRDRCPADCNGFSCWRRIARIAEKLSPYECGFEAFEDARMKFDVRYYLIAILFHSV